MIELSDQVDVMDRQSPGKNSDDTEYITQKENARGG